MDEYILKDFGKLLKRNALAMRKLLAPLNTTAMRLYDRNIEELPVTVDLYTPYILITDYSETGFEKSEVAQIIDTAARMLYVTEEKIFYHYRKKREEGEQHEVREDSFELEVLENGLTFIVDLTKRVDTGLFLDQAVARFTLGGLSRGLDVLNLFSYTGSFSLYAAAGGAKSVTSVDLSTTYSNWCKRNFEANAIRSDSIITLTMDAKEFINEAIAQKKQYDIIIFDPPPFSNSRKMEREFDLQRDYSEYIELLYNLLPNNGILYFSANLASFRFTKSKVGGYTIKEVTKEFRAPGFSAKRSTLRNWILTKDNSIKTIERKREYTPSKIEKKKRPTPMREEDDLVLHWEDDTQEQKNARQRRYEKRHPGEEAPPRQRREQKEYRPDQRPKRDYPDRRRSDDRPRRDYQERSEYRSGDRSKRDYPDRRRSDDRPRRDYQERSEYRSGDRSKRDYSDRRRSDERPRRDYQGRSEERSRRDYPDRQRSDERPRRDYQGRSDERPRRDYPDRRRSDERPRGDYQGRSDDRPRRDYPDRRSSGERPRRDYQGRSDDRPRRDYPDRRRSDERPRRDYQERSDERPRRDSPTKRQQGPKPYGYDRFKPSQSRGGSEERFYRQIKEDEEK